MSTLKSPLNKSTSKANYSFPRAQRMPEIRPLNEKIYYLPDVANKRATSMGFGKKRQICPNIKSPSPDQYEKESIFSRSLKKGVIMGLGRDDVKAISILPKAKNPGVGEYELALKNTTSSKYTMRGRDGFPQIFQGNIGPGPGNYDIKQDTDKSFFFDSRRKTPQIYSIKPEHKQNQSFHINLGPGKYETNLGAMGKQVLGNKKTQTAFAFPKENREVFELNQTTPGPGAYGHFSQFGK